MKLARYEIRGARPRLGAVVGAAGSGATSEGVRLVDLAAAAAASGRDAGLFSSPRTLLAAGEAALEAVAAALRFAQERGVDGAPWGVTLGEGELRAPIARPGKILALAGNYRAHRAEGGVASPEPDQALPELFCKPVTSVIGPEEAIRLPGPPVATVDYEGELGVVIGRTCSRVSADEAMSYVGGYLCLNDVSGRKLDPGFERSPAFLERAKFFDWLAGKWFDTFCPIGPWMVTADEIADPMALTLITRVNGEERQRTSTGEMIHSIARTIAWCSTVSTLEPGDVIATGTPSGVGSSRGIFLKAGDVVEVEIEGIGILRNPVAGRP
jgi:2-keto-4-pentenoate hydratase/2-oxohepta-3-ene-1,7-dioic acid hydratase in catechol pathway